MTEGPASTTLLRPKYRTIAELGRGGMAVVYLATMSGPGQFKKLQVVKRLRPALAADEAFLAMFLEEAKLAAQINHPNVVQTNEVGFDGEHYFIAMEFLDGQSLETIIRSAAEKGTPLPLAMHVRILVDVLAGLDAAHEQRGFDGSPLNVVHRDMSPHNAMVTYNGQVKVLDFGIAKAAGSSEDTRSGILKGKAAYMSPEQFRSGVIDRRADVFAVGVMLWQALTGRRLWPSDLSDIEIFQKLCANELPTPSSVKPDVPRELEAICMKALAVEPEQRYATAYEFQTALEAWLTKDQTPHTNRAVGDFVATLFAEDRTKMKAALEAHSKRGDEDDAPPPSQTLAVAADAVAVPVLTHDGELAEHSPTKQSFVTAAPTASGSRNVRLGMGAAAALVVLVAIGFAVSRARSHTAKGAAAGADSRATAAASPVAPTDTATPTTAVQITASPAEAHVFIDDHEIAGNPAKGSFVRDGASHVIRVEADGYKPRRELLAFDKDSVSAEIALEVVPKHAAWVAPPAGARPKGPREAPKEPASSAGTPTPAPTPAPQPTMTRPTAEPRQLDTKDPWR